MMDRLFPLEESIGFWIYRVHSQGIASLRKSFLDAGYDVTPEQFIVLATVSEQEGMNQNHLCEKTFKDRHNMTRLLNVLEKKGYIERRPDETDKRAYCVVLKDAGRKVQERLTPIFLNHRKRVFRDLMPEDVITTRKVLEHIVKNIER